MKKSYLAILVIFLILVIDQASKMWVKTTFCYGEERLILGLSWARLNFVENPGMAFGWKFGGEYGKLALSVFRIVAIGFLIYYVRSLIQKKVSSGLIVSFSLILAGAIGNIIDSAFYGLIFSESDYHCSGGPAKLFPAAGGYESFLHGRVVDMLFFPLWHNEAGNVVFFQPVFNVADSAITTGVLSILLFQRHYFSGHDEKPQVNQADENHSEESVDGNLAETNFVTETVDNFTTDTERTFQENLTENRQVVENTVDNIVSDDSQDEKKDEKSDS